MNLFLSYKISISVILCLLMVESRGQNLVPNGGFEEGNTCPTFVGNFDIDILHWYTSAINYNGFLPTPEWYHACSEQDIFTPPEVGFGNQEPFEGGGYAGIVTYSITGFDTNYREIIGVPLMTPLTPGAIYQISFQLGRLTNPGVDIAANNIGFQFTTHQYFDYWDFPTNSAHFSIDTILNINGEWLSISEEFVADSAYTFFHIGNFYNDANTEVEIQDEAAGAAYYIIDDVVITSILSTDADRRSSEISLYPNPCANQLTVQNFSQHGIQRIEIFDVMGRRVFEKEYQSLSQEVILNEVGSFLKGTFILKITTEKSTVYETVVKV